MTYEVWTDTQGGASVYLFGTAVCPEPDSKAFVTGLVEYNEETLRVYFAPFVATIPIAWSNHRLLPSLTVALTSGTYLYKVSCWLMDLDPDSYVRYLNFVGDGPPTTVAYVNYLLRT